MAKLHVKTGDTVVVISGNSKGVKGEVLAVSPDEKKVIVKGANVVTKHTKPRRQGETGGRIEGEAPLYSSKVIRICPKCGVLGAEIIIAVVLQQGGDTLTLGF